MNANELANYIEDEYLNGMECEHGFLVFENGGCPNEGCKRQDFYKAATMLRQQQAELTEAGGMIGVLREQLQEEIQARADVLDDLNNRMMKFMKSYNEMAYKLEEVGGAYTHPVKELTDFEILQISECYPDRLHFARAILRKAQEK